MTTARNGQLNVIAAQLDEQLKAARNSVTSDRSQLSAVLKEIENLKSTRTLILQDYPIWPVSTEIRRQISASVAVPPIAHLLITLALNIFSP